MVKHKVENKTLIFDKEVTEIGHEFQPISLDFDKVIGANVIKIGDYFLARHEGIKSIEFPNLEVVGYGFVSAKSKLKEVILTNLRKCGDGFLAWSEYIKKVDLPRLRHIGNHFMENNKALKSLSLPAAYIIQGQMLTQNRVLESVEFNSLRWSHPVYETGFYWLFRNKPNLHTIYNNDLVFDVQSFGSHLIAFDKHIGVEPYLYKGIVVMNGYNFVSALMAGELKQEFLLEKDGYISHSEDLDEGCEELLRDIVDIMEGDAFKKLRYELLSPSHKERIQGL